MKTKTEMVALATEDTDLAILPAKTAKREAEAHADESGKPVTLRHVISDKLIETVRPTESTCVKIAHKARDFTAPQGRARGGRGR
jgi:hypothetical protein